MSLSDRGKTVVALWRQWRKNMRDLNDGWFPYYDSGKQIHLFFEYLQADQPHILDMPRMDPYQQAKAWVLQDLEI